MRALPSSPQTSVHSSPAAFGPAFRSFSTRALHKQAPNPREQPSGPAARWEQQEEAPGAPALPLGSMEHLWLGIWQQPSPACRLGLASAPRVPFQQGCDANRAALSALTRASTWAPTPQVVWVERDSSGERCSLQGKKAKVGEKGAGEGDSSHGHDRRSQSKVAQPRHQPDLYVC